MSCTSTSAFRQVIEACSFLHPVVFPLIVRLTICNTDPTLTGKPSLQVLEEAGEEGLTSAEINKRVIDRRPRGCPPHSVRGERSRVRCSTKAHVLMSWQAKQCLSCTCCVVSSALLQFSTAAENLSVSRKCFFRCEVVGSCLMSCLQPVQNVRSW